MCLARLWSALKKLVTVVASGAGNWVSGGKRWEGNSFSLGVSSCVWDVVLWPSVTFSNKEMQSLFNCLRERERWSLLPRKLQPHGKSWKSTGWTGKMCVQPPPPVRSHESSGKSWFLWAWVTAMQNEHMTWQAGKAPTGGEIWKWFLKCEAHLASGRCCDSLLQKQPQRRRSCWTGRWWDTGPTSLGRGECTSWPPPQLAFEDENHTSVSALTSRNPNGEGVPLWPICSQTEQRLQLVNVTTGHKLKESEVEFQTESSPW